MRKIILAMIVLCALAAASAPGYAQQTTGNISGRVLDAQSAAMPGVTVTGRNTQTGFVRTEVSDGEGVYRLTALPVGTYDITAELQGFSTFDRKGVVVNVSQTTDLNIELKLGGITESIIVGAESPMVKTTDSSVGGVVDVSKIESLPLNGRQFANLAMTIPGVGLGFHSDPTKSTQYSPQIAGGNGRNVNYQIDGGDNNDDTVGGLLQLFPLEAIQEFNFVTQRYKAEYGRSNGGVMNIVTKSGTNNVRGSFFTSVRDKSLNAKTQTEKLANVGKQDYRRYQYGGSFGGPIVQNKAHFFAAFERTQQDTTQAVNTQGLIPSSDGVFPTPSRENLFTAKASANLTPSQYASVRYGRNTNSQVYNAGPLLATGELGRQRQHLQLDQPEPQLGAGRVEAQRVRVPVRRLRQSHPGAHRRSAADVPERRGDRLQHQHAADDHPAQVPVPRRLFLAHDGRRRPRPRLQGGRELHLRAEAVRHLQLRKRRLRLHAHHQRPQRPDQADHEKQAWRVRQPADEPVRLLHSGRLARERPADGQRRAPLRPGHGLPDRSVEDPELHRADGGGRGRPLQRRARVRRVRQEGAGGQEQHPAEDRRRVRPPRRRQGHRARRLGHLLRLRLHERQHPVPGVERARGVGRDLHGDRHRGDQERGRKHSSESASRSTNIARRNEVRTRTGRSTARTSPPRRSGSPGPARRRSAGRTSSRRRRSSTWITCTSMGGTSASAGR